MLRFLVLLLLLANAGFYAWSHGLLLAWGVGPTQQSEPQRLQQLMPGPLMPRPLMKTRAPSRSFHRSNRLSRRVTSALFLRPAFRLN